MKRARAALVALFTVAAGCFSGSPADDLYACAPKPLECPAGYFCAADKRCWRDGHDDAAANTRDAGQDAGSDAGLPASCGDGRRDGDETDVDCGGSCSACDVGLGCAVDGDCQTRHCLGPRCELATAPPFWRALPNMMRARVSPTVVAAPDGRILAIGGGDGQNAISNHVEAYGAGAWSALADTVLARSGGSGGFVGGRLYVAGGLGNETQLEVYDGSANSWSVVSNNIGFQIDQAGYVVASDALFILGGLSAPTVITGDTHRYDPVNGWVTLAALAPRRSLGAALGADGLIYAAGGSDGNAALTTVQHYSTASGQWSDGVALPAATDRLAAAAGADGRLYTIAGAVANAPVATVNAFTLGGDHWTAVAPLQNARFSLGVAVGSDGLIYAVGGAGATAGALANVEAYGPLAQLASATLAPGSSPVVSGSNFAAGAAVHVYLGASASGSPLASGSSDSKGVLPPLTLPAMSSPGSYMLTVIDSRSRYPVVLRFTVTN